MLERWISEKLRKQKGEKPQRALYGKIRTTNRPETTMIYWEGPRRT
jgi:hypothetical protein